MHFRSAAFVIYFVFSLLILSTFAFAPFHPQKYRNFILGVPDVDAYPGDNVTIAGNITNTGIWTVRQINLSLQNLPYKFELNPNLFEELRILRDWNPEQGVFRLPNHFAITIFVPQNATGAHLVKVNAQEMWSPHQISNSTQFILKVLGIPKISASELSVPSKVTRFESFTVSFDLKNEGIAPAIVNTTLNVPGDWQVSEKDKQITIGGNFSEKVSFTVTPSGSPGTISVKAAYEFRGSVTNITKTSSLITPIAPIVIEEPKPVEKPKPTGLAAFVEFVKGLSPIIVGILVLILIIIIWNFYKIISVLSKKKKKPE